LVELAQVRRFSPEETRRLASLAGNIVDLDQRVDIDIYENGCARVSYRHELLNLSTRPMTRLARELWFEQTSGPLAIDPVPAGGHNVAIHPIHDTRNMVKFACQISPPIQPGESAVIAYACEGGQFLHDHYWRQALPRYTRHFTISLRHRNAERLAECIATEEHPDGLESSAAQWLTWTQEGGDVVITLTRDYLRPNQAVTIRWVISRATSR
jgi:hypothetical protein